MADLEPQDFLRQDDHDVNRGLYDALDGVGQRAVVGVPELQRRRAQLAPSRQRAARHVALQGPLHERRHGQREHRRLDAADWLAPEHRAQLRWSARRLEGAHDLVLHLPQNLHRDGANTELVQNEGHQLPRDRREEDSIVLEVDVQWLPQPRVQLKPRAERRRLLWTAAPGLEAGVAPRSRARENLGALGQDGADHELPQMRLDPDLAPAAELATVLARLGNKRRVPRRPTRRKGEGRNLLHARVSEELGELKPALLDEHQVELVQPRRELLLDRLGELKDALGREQPLQ